MIGTFAPALNQMPTRWLSAKRSFAIGVTLSLAGLRCLFETWEERKRFRLKLEDMLATAPHLIDDIGMTKKQADEEIAKPFWRV